MARYKIIDTDPRLLPVDLSKQLLPGTFEHALNRLVDHEIDLSGFDARYCDDETGASAYPPAMLLKVMLFAYAQNANQWAQTRLIRGGNYKSAESPTKINRV